MGLSTCLILYVKNRNRQDLQDKTAPYPQHKRAEMTRGHGFCLLGLMELIKYSIQSNLLRIVLCHIQISGKRMAYTENSQGQ